MPVVSEDPKPYYPYPTIYCTSDDSSWTDSDTSTATPYQERNIFEAHCPEGAYIEKGKKDPIQIQDQDIEQGKISRLISL